MSDIAKCADLETPDRFDDSGDAGLAGMPIRRLRSATTRYACGHVLRRGKGAEGEMRHAGPCPDCVAHAFEGAGK